MTQNSVVLEEVGRFTDQQLIAALQRLVRADQALGSRLLVHLGEVDARGLYREQAYSSMFAYCVEALNMSEAEAYLRIQAARLGRQFPLVVQLFEQGALHLSTIKLLGPHLTPDNHVQVLERASGKRKREIELLVAELAPKPDVPSRMRKLPEMRRAPDSRARVPIASPTSALAVHPGPSFLDASIAAPPESQANEAPFALDVPTVRASEASLADRTVGALEAQFALEAPRPRGSCVPLSPGRYKVEFTAGQGLRDKLEQLQHLLRHRVPDGDLAVIVELAVALLFDKTMKQRFAQTQAPKKARSIQRGDDAQTRTPEQHRAIQPGDERARDAARVQPTSRGAARDTRPPTRDRLAANATDSPGARTRQVNSRYIPRAAVREVYARDGGRCRFVSADGKRCSERGFLELHHHDVPYGKGGKATAHNLRLACRTHNALLAEREYGTRFMRLKQRKSARDHANQIARPGASFQG